MDASTYGLDRDQYEEDPEWHAAVQLVSLSIPIVADSPTSAAAAAASEVITNNVVQAISSQHGKMEANSMCEEVKADSDGSDDKEEFKKPDTILPCARCKSMRTKFCYFNNHKVNQPRHYCKDCKRYWTEGGSLRDVPVGSARQRKNKQPSNCRHATKPSYANGDVPGTSRRRSRVVKTLVLPVPGPAKESEAITHSGSEMVPFRSLSPAHSSEEQKNNSTGLALVSCPSENGARIVPWPGTVPPNNVAGSGSDSLTLGKHQRPKEAIWQKQEKAEKTFWVPKVLRVTNPEDAAKSTIWASLGIE